MMDPVAGSRVRFLTRFRLLGKLFDPGTVEVVITTTDGQVVIPAKRSDVGVYFTDLIVIAGFLMVRFQSSSGEFSETIYNIAKATAEEESTPVVDVVPDQATPRLDRATARSRLMAAGIAYDESWSDAKVSGALDGLNQNERQRRVHR